MKHKTKSNRLAKNNKPVLIFLFGFLTGIIIAVLGIYMLNTIKIPNKTNLLKLNKKINAEIKSNIKKPNVVNNYEFYNLLPKTEVINKTNGNNTASNNLNNKLQHYIQVGAFNKITEADELKARLTIQGFENTIEISSITSEYRYKVLIGPFVSEELANIKKNQVDTAGFKSTIVQITKPIKNN